MWGARFADRADALAQHGAHSASANAVRLRASARAAPGHSAFGRTSGVVECWVTYALRALGSSTDETLEEFHATRRRIVAE
jgi:hypothetical protein